jgi:UDP-N-acetylmuramoyl-tripeptide--D-alanyl-D-alanine ligase
VINATAAYAAARHLGIPPEEIAEGLGECRPEWGRMETRATAHGAFLLEDVYNASPASYRAALDVMTARTAARKYVVAGDMLDLGDHAEDAHRELGRALGEAGLEGLYVLGDWRKVVAEAAWENGLQRQRIRWGLDHEGIVKDLERTLHPGDVVLVKGSRDMRMEKISRALAPAT